MEPLLDRTAHGLIRKPLEIHSASPIHLQLSTALKSLSVAGTSTSTSTPGQPLSFWLLAICTIVDLWRTWKEGVRGRECSEAVLRHSVRRLPGIGGGLAPSICSILPVSRTTLAGRRKNGGVVTVSIPSRRRSSNGLIKGQGVVRECQSGLVFLLYRLYT